MEMKNKDINNITSIIITIIGLIIIGIITIFLIRFQRGLLGIMLAILTIVLLIFWLKEIQKTIKEGISQFSLKTKWIYDIIDYGTEITIIAEVPGPENKIKVGLINHNLKILGGKGFKKIIKLPEEAEIIEKFYRNGILQVKLKKKSKY